jgi:hypothetical protein
MRHAKCRNTVLKILVASLPGERGLVRRNVTGGRRITYTSEETTVSVIDGAT